MCANSLEAAQYLVKTASTSASLINQCNKGILIGGLKSKGTFLNRWETESIKACVSVPGADDQSISDVGIPFKSLLKPRQGLEGEGMVYRRGEYVLLDQVECDQPAVALVDRFLSVEIEGQHHSFVQGKLLKNKTDDDGHLLMYGSSGYSLVVNNDTTPVHEQDILLPVTCILRSLFTAIHVNLWNLLLLTFNGRIYPCLVWTLPSHSTPKRKTWFGLMGLILTHGLQK